MNICCFISLVVLEAFAKASILAATTGKNRPKGHGKILNYLRTKTDCLYNLSPIQVDGAL
jgi:hypothetical protein